MNGIGHVLAYHLTWTTYGTWLPGDERGWVKKGHAGVKSANRHIEDFARKRMVESSVMLTTSQREIVEHTIAAHCEIRTWRLHAVNARTNHVHVVVSADRNPDVIMEQFKAWCSRKLSDADGLVDYVGAKKAGRRHWFTEGGDKELIHDEEYFRNAINYVLKGQ